MRFQIRIALILLFHLVYCLPFTIMKVGTEVVKRVVTKAAPRKEKAIATKQILTKPTSTVAPVYFPSAVEFREWLVKNHETEKELWVGFYKKHTGKACCSYDEVVDQSLCFGWIDGIRRSIDENSYTNRITPRNPKKSNWSTVNLNKMKVLTKAGLVTPAGLAALEKWTSK